MVYHIFLTYTPYASVDKSKDSSPTCHDTGADEPEVDPYNHASVPQVVKKENVTSCCGGKITVQRS